MAPDINSLPPSRSTSASPMSTRIINTSMPPTDSLLRRTPSPSPRSSSVSLAAAATINAADLSRRNSTSRNRDSPRPNRASERRRSAVAMNLNLNDPTLPAPGELASGDHRTSHSHSYRASSPISAVMGDPHHHRAPSLGELHQELEQEQEAQVNRLLQMIRIQQDQLQQLQNRHSHHPPGMAVDDLTPNSEQSFSLPAAVALPHLPPPQPLVTHLRSSRPTSQATSPALHPRRQYSHDGREEFPSLVSVPNSPQEAPIRRGSREESAYYQAETSNLTRENQMLRHRIRELERQVSEMKERSNSTSSQSPGARHRSSGTLSAAARESIPAHPSNLATTSSQGQGGTGLTTEAGVETGTT